MRAGFRLKHFECERRQLSAARQTVETLRPALGLPFDIRRTAQSTLETALREWNPRHADVDHWDWEEILREHRHPDRWCFALWSEGRLCALAAAKMQGSAIVFTYLEGDPRPDCPLKKQRLLIALDAVARYGRMSGKSEIRIDPINEALANHYESDYGFERADEGSRTYYRREL